MEQEKLCMSIHLAVIIAYPDLGLSARPNHPSWPQSQQALGYQAHLPKALDPLRACPLLLLDFSSAYLVLALLAYLPCQAPCLPLKPDDQLSFTSHGALASLTDAV